jgi:hypothetical protein
MEAFENMSEPARVTRMELRKVKTSRSFKDVVYEPNVEMYMCDLKRETRNEKWE